MVRDAVAALLGDTPFVYVDCGARGASVPSWLRPARAYEYVGIEADADECERLRARQKPGHTYVHAVLARGRERRTLYVTHSRACSSLLRPNHALLASFGELGHAFNVEREVEVTTTSLDEVMQASRFDATEFLELDVQGAELDVLSGAERMLHSSVIGLQVEVEFAEMYQEQPLFGDVDRFLRQRGFQLFDLARYHVRRGLAQSHAPTRGQLLWGQATYLRLPERCGSPEMSRRLAALALLVGVPDLALEILAAFTGKEADLASAAREEILASGARRVWRD